MIELRFIKTNNEIRLQQRDGFKQVNGNITTESIWVDIPLWDSEKQELKSTFDLSKIKLRKEQTNDKTIGDTENR